MALCFSLSCENNSFFPYFKKRKSKMQFLLCDILTVNCAFTLSRVKPVFFFSFYIYGKQSQCTIVRRKEKCDHK